MRYAILHIADLHRDIENDLGNTALIESIARDLGRFATQEPRIETPAVCIVSGDLVYGVQPHSTGAADELSRQYEQAEAFLSTLAERCFQGDRARVVLAPGNHDVCYETFTRSTKRVDIPNDTGKRRQLVADLFGGRSTLRWSWDDLCFYSIEDEELYLQRLALFSETYTRFYQGERTFLLDPARQFDIFTYPELQLSVLMLNSCYNSDPLRRAGAFHPTCIAEALRLLGGPQHRGHLMAATWHHSLSGTAYQDNYLDVDILQVLIDADVSIALHGHQHKPHCIDEHYRVGPRKRKLTVISTGTLCAAPQGLVAGKPRSYNVIEIDTNRWAGRVHQRQMVNSDFTLPIWGPGHFNETNSSYMDFEICPPTATRQQSLDSFLSLEQAEKYLGSRQWVRALDVLKPVSVMPLARPFIVRALGGLGDSHKTIDLLWPPTTPAEAVMVGGAIIDVGPRQQARAFVELDFVKSSTDASIGDVVRRLAERQLR